jgi:hypothetical protein
VRTNVEGRARATLELDATFPEAFSYLSGVRELPDGRVLAADPLSQVLLRVDLDSGTADTIGRHGEGPQEYQGPDKVLPLPGDSSLLVDLGNGRLTVVDPGGRFVGWIPMVRQTSDGRTRTIHPRFVDAAGYLYLGASSRPENGPPDSMAVLRMDRQTEEETPVAWKWLPEYRRLQRGAKRPALNPADDWAVGGDGRVAVVRANGFSVDWVFPDGRIVNAPAYPAETFPVGQPEKETELEAMMAGAIYTTTVVGEGVTGSYQMRRGVPAGDGLGIEDFEWPELLPPFRVEGTLVSPAGEAWVSRFMPSERAPRIEIFDDAGNWMGYVELPPKSKLIGFGSSPGGESVAYLVRTDEVGLIWLERYRIQRVGG